MADHGKTSTTTAGGQGVTLSAFEGALGHGVEVLDTPPEGLAASSPSGRCSGKATKQLVALFQTSRGDRLGIKSLQDQPRDSARNRQRARVTPSDASPTPAQAERVLSQLDLARSKQPNESLGGTRINAQTFTEEVERPGGAVCLFSVRPRDARRHAALKQEEVPNWTVEIGDQRLLVIAIEPVCGGVEYARHSARIVVSEIVRDRSADLSDNGALMWIAFGKMYLHHESPDDLSFVFDGKGSNDQCRERVTDETKRWILVCQHGSNVFADSLSPI